MLHGDTISLAGILDISLLVDVCGVCVVDMPGSGALCTVMSHDRDLGVCCNGFRPIFPLIN